MLWRIRALFAMVFAIGWTGYCAAAAVIEGRKDPYSERVTRLFQRWARGLLRVAGIHLEVHGTENARPDHHYLIAANHSSAIDIPASIAALPLAVRIISKKELFRIPVLSMGMRAVGILEIDRSNREKAVRTLAQAKEVMASRDVSILMYPEGTRNRVDQTVRPFKKGIGVLALQSRTPILPISISGAKPLLPKGSILPRPGTVRVVIHPPIDVSLYSYDSRVELLRHAHEAVASGMPPETQADSGA